MTEEELEQKAKEYRIEIGYTSASYLEQQFEKAYKDGYKEGQKDFDTTVTKLLNTYGVTYIDTDSIGGLIGFHQLFLDIEKENAELKAQIEKLLKELKDKGIVKSWYYNGQFKWELAE